MRKLTSFILSLYSSAPVLHTSSCQNHLLKYGSDILFINIEWFPTRMKPKFFSLPLKGCHSWLPSCCLKKPWNLSCWKRKRFHPCPHSLRSSLLCSFNSYSFLKTWLNDPLLWEAFRGHSCKASCKAASVFCTPKRPISGIVLGWFILSCFVLSLTALIKSFLTPTISCSHLWTLLLIQSYACLREAVQCRRKSKTWEPTRLRFKSWLLWLALDFTFSRSATIFAWEYICKIQDNDTYIAIYSLWHIVGLNKLLECLIDRWYNNCWRNS